MAQGTSEMTALYCPGPRGIEFKIDAEGNRSWYLYDGLGSVLAEVNDSGSMTAVRSYDVYGGLRAGSDQGSGSQKFCGSLGHSTEPSTGLIYMRARWYDPAIGRFISEDPAGDGVNWYAYCTNNPVNMVDEDGRFFGFIGLTLGSALSSGLRSAFGATATAVLRKVGQGMALAIFQQAIQDGINGKFSGWGHYAYVAAAGAILSGSGIAAGTAVRQAMIANGISTGAASFAGQMAATRLIVFEILVGKAMADAADE